MRLNYNLIEVPLEFSFAISRGSKEVSKTIIVEVETEYQGETYTGIGEIVFSRFYGEDEDTVIQFLQAVDQGELLKDLDPFNVEDFEARINQFAGNMAAKSGLDIALYDLRAKIKQQPLYQYLGLDPKQAPKTSYTIGIADLDIIKLKTQTALERGYDILKVKLGSPDDIKIIKLIRSLAPQATIRVDANAAWQMDQALEVLNVIKDYNIEFVEEPLVLESKPEDYAKLYKESPLELMADESCKTSHDIPHCTKYFHSINIKHTKCGGITEALRMIKAAREHNLKIMLGCFSETSVSISAMAHISPLVDYADLDGSLLLKEDPYENNLFSANQIVLPGKPGLGIVI